MDSKTYEAIVVTKFGSENELKLQQKDLPVLGPKEVGVRMRAVGVNPVDTYIRSGNYARKPTLPYTPGSDGAGDVVMVGSEVTKVSVGDRVYLAGSHSGSYTQLCIASEDSLQPLPTHITYEQGACVHVPYGTAYRAIFIRGGAKPGDSVLVHGASGSVGMAAVQICVANGITVYGTASTPEGRHAVTLAGATAVFNHRTEGYMAEIKATTGGRGVDLVIEMLANVNLEADMGILALNGRIMVVGNRGTITVNPRGLMLCEGDVRGVALAKTRPEEWKIIHAAIQAGLRASTLQPLVEQTIPLGEASRAHVQIMGSTRLGNLVLLP